MAARTAYLAPQWAQPKLRSDPIPQFRAMRHRMAREAIRHENGVPCGNDQQKWKVSQSELAAWAELMPRRSMLRALTNRRAPWLNWTGLPRNERHRLRLAQGRQREEHADRPRRRARQQARILPVDRCRPAGLDHALAQVARRRRSGAPEWHPRRRRYRQGCQARA